MIFHPREQIKHLKPLKQGLLAKVEETADSASLYPYNINSFLCFNNIFLPAIQFSLLALLSLLVYRMPKEGDAKPQRMGHRPSYGFSFKCDERAEKRKEVSLILFCTMLHLFYVLASPDQTQRFYVF